jgi:hypothetical membrane protein
VLAISAHNGLRLAELGFLLLAIAGAALALTTVWPSKNQPGKLVSGVALAVGSVLLIIAAHWGKFG